MTLNKPLEAQANLSLPHLSLLSHIRLDHSKQCYNDVKIGKKPCLGLCRVHKKGSISCRYIISDFHIKCLILL